MKPGDALKTLNLNVANNAVGKRLDKYLLDNIEDYSRSHLQKLIKKGYILLNGEKTKPSHKIKRGEAISIVIPKPKEMELFPQDIPVEIIFEDQFMAIINKPVGMVVHPSPGHDDGSLVNALLYQLDDLSGINDVLRPGIVHRLDKETSGVMVVAKNDKAHLELARQFHDREVFKEYRAIVHGQIGNKKGSIKLPIGRHPKHYNLMCAQYGEGKKAETNYEVIELFDEFTYVAAFPKTGRTHQIRVHFQSLRHPLLCDKSYGGKIVYGIPINRVALHAHKLHIKHPDTGEAMTFESPIPEDFNDALECIRANDYGEDD